MTDSPSGPSVPNDLQDSFTFLNYLISGYQGSFVAQNILKDLKHPFFSEETQLRNEKILSKLDRWMKTLAEGSPFLSRSWKEPETFELVEALDAVEKLRSEYNKVMRKITEIFDRQALERRSIQDACYVAAAIGRLAYSKDIFVRGWISFSQAFQLQELAQRHERLLGQVQEELKVAYGIIHALKAPEKPELVFKNLREYAQDAPILLRAQAHDLNLLLSWYGEFTFEGAGITEGEAQEWKAKGAQPHVAAFWKVYEFSPEEALLWVTQGIPDASFAFQWRKMKFSSQQARQWMEKGISPLLAKRWSDHNFTPEDAHYFLSQGITDPKQAKGKKG